MARSRLQIKFKANLSKFMELCLNIKSKKKADMLDHPSSRHRGISLTQIPNNDNKIIIMIMITESPSADPVTANRVGCGKR